MKSRKDVVITVWCPEQLKERLRVDAALEGRTLSQHVCWLIEQRLHGQRTKNRIRKALADGSAA